MKRLLQACFILLMSLSVVTGNSVYAAPIQSISDTETAQAEQEAEDQEEQEIQEDTADSQEGEGQEEILPGSGLYLSAPSAILMEASTGKIIYEENARERLHPASVTKIMTLLVIFDALEAGKITLEEEVTVSERAASMGGSQVYLEPMEVQTVDTMIKCIAVASANDACVAMAEHLYGSESEFVNQMNERASQLGMEDTHFENTNGLDTDEHLTTAYDIALMSRELITKYPEIHNYSTIWMDTITHTTKKGTTEFGLSNTNKLVKQYEYATGLKTGSTSKAKYCVSATAKKGDIELIAVVMAAPDYKVRFEDATALLNYGFSKCTLYTDDNADQLPSIAIAQGEKAQAECEYEDPFRYLDIEGVDLSRVEKEVHLEEKAKAPVKTGDMAGKAVYLVDGEEIGSVNILYKETVEKAEFKDYLMKAIKLFSI